MQLPTLTKSKEEKLKTQVHLLTQELVEEKQKRKELEVFLASQHTAQEVWSLTESVNRLTTQKDNWSNRYYRQKGALERLINNLDIAPGYSKEQVISDLKGIRDLL